MFTYQYSYSAILVAALSILLQTGSIVAQLINGGSVSIGPLLLWINRCDVYDVNRFDLTCLSEECLTGTKMHGSQTVAISILDLSIFMQPALERSHAVSLNLLRLKLEARTRSNIQNGGRGSRIFITLELSYITSWKDTLTFLAYKQVSQCFITFYNWWQRKMLHGLWSIPFAF